MNGYYGRYFWRILLCLLIVSANNCSLAAQSDTHKTGKPASTDDGRRIYRDGILPDGKPLKAIVAGDVEVLGTQFSCQNCHGRSGMGAAEGDVIVPAIAGPILYSSSPQPKRPAYNLHSLAKVLTTGVTPSGRTLDTLMPRFKFSENEIKALAGYLNHLSAESSPGVTEKVIRFATVISDNEDKDTRQAVIDVLQTYVDEKNRQTRLESQRPDRGYSPASRLPTVFRKWVLDVWLVKGPADTWRSQLDTYYEQKPVFALIGGVALNNWKPIGEFCESSEIPCLFPSTNLPDTKKGNFYSVHFSQGVVLEAKLIAHHLTSQKFKSVIQVHCGKLSKNAASALKTQLSLTGISVKTLEFNCQQPLSEKTLVKKISANPHAAIILWLDKNELAQFIHTLPADRIYLSSTLLKGDSEKQFPSLPSRAYIAHPFNLPGKRDSALMRFKVWARSRNIKVTHPRLQSEAFYACLVANDAISHLGRFLIRDYVLDMLDHAQAMMAYLPNYPRPTVGPGQRFLSKGGYILALKEGKLDTSDAAWLSP